MLIWFLVKITNIKKKIFRIYHQLYALFHGYFWLPCPICEENFGGHEWAHDIYTGSHAVYFNTPTGGIAVCPNCVEEAKKRNIKKYGYV